LGVPLNKVPVTTFFTEYVLIAVITWELVTVEVDLLAKRAIAPATSGVAIEVPLIVL